MIFVLFPPGCYGSYFSKCLYNYTNLSPANNDLFDFGEHGHSHSIRKTVDRADKLKLGHALPSVVESEFQTVYIKPSPGHALDYFNNQFAKENNFDLFGYINELLPNQDIVSALSKWNIDQITIDQTPVWVLREFFSFWIADCLNNSYCANNDPGHVMISTLDIFDNFYVKFQETVEQLGLTTTTDADVIVSNHRAFLQNQKFHQSQIKCQLWADHVTTASTDMLSPCQTIFDEAYIQHLLRQKGFEIECNNLNTFPNSATQLRSIIYKP